MKKISSISRHLPPLDRTQYIKYIYHQCLKVNKVSNKKKFKIYLNTLESYVYNYFYLLNNNECYQQRLKVLCFNLRTNFKLTEQFTPEELSLLDFKPIAESKSEVATNLIEIKRELDKLNDEIFKPLILGDKNRISQLNICRGCKSEVFPEIKTVRAADEPQNISYRCTKCNITWFG